MLQMRLVFLVMGTSLVWSNSVFAGESNDRIDIILSQILGMGKRLDVLASDVGDLKTDVGKVVKTEDLTRRRVEKIEDAIQKIVKKEGEMENAVQNIAKKEEEMEGAIQNIVKKEEKMEEAMQNIVKKEEKMEEAMQNIVKKEGKMEGAMQNIVKKEEEVEKQVSEMKNQTNEVGKKMSEMKKNMEKFDTVISIALASGWKYYGRGAQDGADQEIQYYHSTLPQCVEFCQRKRATDGNTWNGFIWRPKDALCACKKNDRGHNTGFSDWMHFKAE